MANWIFPLAGNPPVTESHAQGDPGVDWGVPVGTPVHAIADGVVTRIGMDGYGPAYVEVDHGGGVQSFYGHNNNALVRVGDHVRQGQVIADSGNLGHSSGPHLELGIRVNGHLVDPVAWLQSGGAGHVPGGPTVQTVGDTGGGGGGGALNPFPGGNWDPLNWVPNAAGAAVSDVAGAVSSTGEGLAHSLFITAVKGVLIVTGGGLVVVGLANTARRTQTVQNAQQQAGQAAQIAATAA